MFAVLSLWAPSLLCPGERWSRWWGGTKIRGRTEIQDHRIMELVCLVFNACPCVTVLLPGVPRLCLERSSSIYNITAGVFQANTVTVQTIRRRKPVREKGERHEWTNIRWRTPHDICWIDQGLWHKSGGLVFFSKSSNQLLKLYISTTFYDILGPYLMINVSLTCIQFCWHSASVVAGGAGAYDVAKKDDHLSTPGAPTKGLSAAAAGKGLLGSRPWNSSLPAIWQVWQDEMIIKSRTIWFDIMKYIV